MIHQAFCRIILGAKPYHLAWLTLKLWEFTQIYCDLGCYPLKNGLPFYRGHFLGGTLEGTWRIDDPLAMPQ